MAIDYTTVKKVTVEPEHNGHGYWVLVRMQDKRTMYEHHDTRKAADRFARDVRAKARAAGKKQR